MLSCGCEPPVEPMAAPLRFTAGACVLNCPPVHPDQTLFAGELAGLPVAPLAASGACV